MFDFVRLPNPIERLEFDWVRLVFCSVLFDWIGRGDIQGGGLMLLMSCDKNAANHIIIIDLFD